MNVFSGDLIVNGEIIEIRNTGSNLALFEIVVTGGEGVCNNKVIAFPASVAPTKEAYNRAYASALTAFTTGANIRVHNYIDDSCKKASYISLRK